MKTLILIAVRLHSTRLPRKAFLKVGEKTILEHLIDRLSQTRKPDGLIVCTSTHQDDEAIARFAEKKGVKWFVGSEYDVLDRFIQAAERESADTVVRVTGDNPLTDPEIMDQMIQFHLTQKAEYTYTEDPPRGTRSEILDLEAMRRAHRLAEYPSQTEYMTLYFRQPDFFKIAKFNVSEDSFRRPQYRLTIDTPEDLKLIKTLYNYLYDHDKNDFPPLKRIIEFLDQNPSIASLNMSINPKWETIPINARLRKEA